MKAIRLAARPDIVRRSLAVSAVVGGDGDPAWPTAAGPPPYPQKQTSSEAAAMSANCQKSTSIDPMVRPVPCGNVSCTVIARRTTLRHAIA